MDDEFIYGLIKQIAVTFQIPVDLLTNNTKYKNYEKENEDKS